jgi:hypothetical protein
MIKNDLFSRGYTFEAFLLLDERMQHGSRQLLLCFGWLVHHLNIGDQLAQLVLQNESILDYDDTSLLYQVNRYDIHCDDITRVLQHSIAEPVNSPAQEANLVERVKQAMRINSKLRFGLRRLHGLVMENAHLQHQVSND